MPTPPRTASIALDVAADYLASLQARIDGKTPRLTSGFHTLDHALPGWLDGPALVAIASRPDVDRVSFTQSITEHIAAQGPMVLWFSLTAGREQVIERSVARRAQVPIPVLHGGAFTIDKTRRVRVIQAINEFSHLPMLIDDADQGIDDIVAKALHLHRRGAREPRLKLGLIVIDSMQMLSTGLGAPGYSSALRLRMLAHSMGVPIIALCALSADDARDAGDTPTVRELPFDSDLNTHANLMLLLNGHEAAPGAMPTDVIVARDFAGQSRNVLL